MKKQPKKLIAFRFSKAAQSALSAVQRRTGKTKTRITEDAIIELANKILST